MYNYHTMGKTKHNIQPAGRGATRLLLGWFSAFFWVCVIIIGISAVFYGVFEQRYRGRVYPHVTAGEISVSGKTPKEIEDYWLNQNARFADVRFELRYDGKIATISGSDLELGFDATLSATQAYLVGRSEQILSNLYLKLSGSPVALAPYFRWESDVIDKTLASIAAKVDVPVVNALFHFENGKVTAFKPSSSGRKLNLDEANTRLTEAFHTAARTQEKRVTILMPVETILPTATTDQVNSYGIKERISSGYSEFSGSSAGRIHNVALAAARLNGILIKPGETFSFNDAIGDISAATGYQSAYIIKEGRTVLGDGGGVCQVSTTIFRAALAAGLPIVERHAHAYRVHYYEEGGFKAGMDATVYGPTYDLKFTNDTPNYILIQAKINLARLSLTFDFYGTSDGRKPQISNQKLWDVTPPPPDLYQDDPTLPRGTVKQVDFAAWGAKASFDYLVTRNGETLQKKTFFSNFRPWQAVYLQGVQ